MKKIDYSTEQNLLREGYSPTAIKCVSQLWHTFQISGVLSTQNAQINNAAGELQEKVYRSSGEFVPFKIMRRLLLKVLRIKTTEDEN